MNTRIKILAKTLILLISAIISFFVLSEVASSPKFYEKTIASLEEKKTTGLGLTTAATLTSTAISAIPGDGATPIAEELAELSSWFLMALSAVYLEKYLVTLIGYVVFRVFIPIICFMIIANQFLKIEGLSRLATKLTIFSLVSILVIPTSEKISQIISTTQEDSSITQILESVNQPEEETEEEGGFFAFFGDIKEGVTDVTEKVKNVLSDFIEAVAIPGRVMTQCCVLLQP